MRQSPLDQKIKIKIKIKDKFKKNKKWVILENSCESAFTSFWGGVSEPDTTPLALQF